VRQADGLMLVQVDELMLVQEDYLIQYSPIMHVGALLC